MLTPPYAKFYDANWRAFDVHGRGVITVAMLAERVMRKAHGPRWEELKSRLELAMTGTAPEPDGRIDVASVQRALTEEGCPTGIDGAAGPLTAHAIGRYQASHGLAVDGAITVLLAASLAKALRAHASRLVDLADKLDVGNMEAKS